MLETSGTVKVLDLGLAREVGPDAQNENVTSTGNAIGTLDYMPPEQFNDSATVDHRADIYGLGATLFVLLCGRSPIAVTGAESRLDRIHALASGQRASFQELRPDLPARLIAFVERMLDSDPGQRPVDAQEVADCLQEFTVGCDLQAPLYDTDVSALARTERIPHSGETDRDDRLLSGGASRNNWRPLMLAFGAVLALLIAAGVIYFKTGSGTLVVRAGDDVSLKQLEDAGVLLTDLKTGVSYRLTIGETSRKTGRYRIDVQQNPSGLKFSAEEFSITRGGVKVVEVTIEMPEPARTGPASLDSATDEFFPVSARIDPPTAASATFGPINMERVIRQWQFTADGSGLLVAAPRDCVVLLDAKTGSVTRRFSGHQIGSNAFAVTADAKTLYSGDATGRILEHDFATGKQRREVVPSTNVAIKQMALSVDQKTLVYVRWWRDLRILNLDSGESQVRSWLIHYCGMDSDTQSVFGVGQDLHLLRHSPSVEKLIGVTPRFDGISGGYWIDAPRKTGVFVRDGGKVHVFDLVTGKDKHQFSTKKAEMPIVRFSPDLTRLVVCHVGRQARVLDIASGQTLVTVTVGPTRRVSAVCFSPDGNSFAVGSVAGAVSVFRLADQRQPDQAGSASSEK